MERVHLKERWMQDSAFHCSIKQKDGFEDTDVCVREREREKGVMFRRGGCIDYHCGRKMACEVPTERNDHHQGRWIQYIQVAHHRS